jgi:hypothetical protein
MAADFDVMRVYKMLDPKPKELLTPSRRFMREGEVLQYNSKERRTKLKYFFLFNDVLLITKKEGKNKFWLKVYIGLRPGLKIGMIGQRRKGRCRSVDRLFYVC